MPLLYIFILIILIILIYVFKKRSTANLKKEIKSELNKENQNKFSNGNIFLLIYNLIIMGLIITTDWSDWGAILVGPTVFIMVLIGSPIITWIAFRKNERKDIIILRSFFISIAISVLAFLITNIYN